VQIIIAKSQNNVDYKPLPVDGFRICLATTIPGEKDAEIECVISHHLFFGSALDGLEYEALLRLGRSDRHGLNRAQRKPFKATKNLAAALRRPDAERLLWIDATKLASQKGIASSPHG
jgi:hypothetical protein